MENNSFENISTRTRHNKKFFNEKYLRCYGSYLYLFVSIVIVIFTIVILHQTYQRASIAAKQLTVYGGISLYTLRILIIVICCIKLVFTVGVWFVNVALSECIYSLTSLNVANVIIVISEFLFLSFTHTFFFESNLLLQIRSMLIILNMTLLIFITVTITSLNWKHRSSCVTCVLVVVVNVLLLVKLKPRMENQIGPQNIYMGFFDATEISLIKNGCYVKENNFDHRLIGRLSDIYTSGIKRKLGCKYVKRADSNHNYHVTSKDYMLSRRCKYTFIYRKEVDCSKKQKLFFKDCQNVTRLRFVLEHDKNLFPRFSCFKGEIVNAHSGNECKLLLESKNLMLIQEFNGIIKPAWTGLCSCTNMPNVIINYDRHIEFKSTATFVEKYKLLTIFNIVLSFAIFQ